MYSSPKLTIFLVSLLVLLNLDALSYTFYVETSEFNDDVYVIENVIGNEESISTDKNADKNETPAKKPKRSQVSNKRMSIQNDRSDFSYREFEQHCTNLKTKPLLKLSKTFESKSLIKGMNLKSIKNAESYWSVHEARDALDNCNKLNKEKLFTITNKLKKIIKEENYYNLSSSFPKIYSFDEHTEKRLKNISQNSEDKYLKDLYSEVLNLRNKLLKLSDNNIIFKHYYNQILDKSKYAKLSFDDKNFISNYNKFRINSKIESLGYNRTSFLKTGIQRADLSKIQIQETYYDDISPMLDLFFLSKKPQYYDVKNNKNIRSPTSIINQFAETLNNIP